MFMRLFYFFLGHGDTFYVLRQYGPMVLRRCRRLLQDEDQALDITQDVFVKMLQNQNKSDVQYPSSLLYRMATNLCLNRIRDNRRRGEFTTDERLGYIADVDDPEPRMEARSVLNFIFKRQQESTRTMAVLHFLDGMTLEEVAREVGMSVSGVRKRLRTLRNTLETKESV